jgi:hypothetical protein
MTQLAEITTTQHKPIIGGNAKRYALDPYDLLTAIYANRPANTVSVFEVRGDGVMLPLADVCGATISTRQGVFTLPLQLPDANSLIFLRDAFWRVVDRLHCLRETPRVLLFVERHTPDIPVKFADSDKQPAAKTTEPRTD